MVDQRTVLEVEVSTGVHTPHIHRDDNNDDYSDKKKTCYHKGVCATKTTLSCC